MNKLIGKIKKVDWQYMANRRESLLFSSITTSAGIFFKKLTGIDWVIN